MELFRQTLREIRYASRSLRKSSGFTAAAILTLTLGIGANVAIFSVVQAVVLAPFPYRDPGRLVFVREISSKLKHEMSVSYPDLVDWRNTAHSFEQMAGIGFRGFDLTSPGSPEHLTGKTVSAGFFRTLGVNLLLGHEFSRADDRDHAAPIVIVSERLWRNRFASNPDALGKTVTLSGVDYTIVGVLPAGFHFQIDATIADAYTPLGQGDPKILNDRTFHPGILCVARLKPNTTLAQARAEMSAVQSELVERYPAADRGTEADVVPLEQEIAGDVSGTLFLLLGAVGLVLLIACANVANLLLARSSVRAREYAIRVALGASRIRIVSQVLAESLLLSLSGGILALAFANWGVRPILSAIAGGLPRGEDAGLNLPVLFYTIAISIAVGILFGLGPALKNSNAGPHDSLKAGGRASAGGHGRTHGTLVALQFALALVLLTGASLLFRTIENLWNVDPGFDTRHIIAFKVGLSPSLTKTASNTRAAYRQLAERVREVPGIQAAEITLLVPLSNNSNAGPFWVGQQPASISEAPRANYYWTGPDYLRTMRIPLLQGRYFSSEDTTSSAPVTVIDSVLAHSYFPHRDPVGQTINIGHWTAARIIGVVSHVRHWGLDDADRYTQNQIYLAFYQLPDPWMPNFAPDITLVVRTPLDAAAVMPTMKSVVYGTGNDQPVYAIHTMRELASASMDSQRFPMILLSAFAVLALLVAAVGIYGVISYSMTSRVREFGIRMALGAVSREILRMVMRQGLRLALTGIAIGAAAAFVLTRILSSFSQLLYGVRAGDPLTFAAAAIVLTGAAVLACYLPARRASRLDPMAVLRHE